MPIYKMKGNRDGLQKYRVRINYLYSAGNARQIYRVAYGADEAKNLEYKLNYEIKQECPSGHTSVGQLFYEYISAEKHEVRDSTLDKSVAHWKVMFCLNYRM